MRWITFFSMTFLAVATAVARPNFLLITVDDMSCDSVGVYGCALPETTPHMDAIAASGLRFQHAHVVVGNCKPSRNVMWSGRYPHNNGVEGFYDNPDPDFPVLCDLMQDAGYFAGIRGKVTHSTPYHPYAWDADLTILDGEKQDMKNADSYYRSTKVGIAMAKAAGKPFCLMVNISDPHKPFYSGARDRNQPSKVFLADEVPVPGFLPDHPDVRKEVALYYSSVRRADDCVGATLKALKEMGKEDDTVVMFLSDHGMPMPFAKTAVWHHSTHTPWMIRWPGVTRPDSVDDEHMVSMVDILPTILDMAGIKHPEGIDGRSVVSILRGGSQANRNYIIKEYNENAGGGRNPMRSIQTREFLYNFNPWSNGTRVFKTATTGTASFRAMKALAPKDEYMAKRLDLFVHGTPEELYQVSKDPDALVNLVANPEYGAVLKNLRAELDAWMVKTGDHALDVFRARDKPELMDAYVTHLQKEADARRTKRKGKSTSSLKLIKLVPPDTIQSGTPTTLGIRYNLPERLGAQKIHVTLKAGEKEKRMARKVEVIRGKGVSTFTFDVPDMPSGASISFAAFVGETYENSLQHLKSKTFAVVK